MGILNLKLNKLQKEAICKFQKFQSLINEVNNIQKKLKKMKRSKKIKLQMQKKFQITLY